MNFVAEIWILLTSLRGYYWIQRRISIEARISKYCRDLCTFHVLLSIIECFTSDWGEKIKNPNKQFKNEKGRWWCDDALRCSAAWKLFKGFKRSSNGALNRPSLVLDQSHHATIAATAMSQGSHTIVLIQYATSYQSRSYLDFPTVPAAMDGTFIMQIHSIDLEVFHYRTSFVDLFNTISKFTNLESLLSFVLCISHREDVRTQAEGIKPVSAAYHLRYIRSIQLHR